MIEVNSLWIGEELTDMEIMSINSHIIVGHKYNLWCYSKIKNIPKEAYICDASKILPENNIFSYKIGAGKGSFSAFSNIFRYKLLLDHGGWWVDTDVVAIKKFDFEQEYIFASENLETVGTCSTTCVIKVPPDSQIMKKCFLISSSHDKEKLEWSTIGPKLLNECLTKSQELKKFVQKPEVFCPINWFEINNKLIIDRNIDFSLSYGVHLWNEMWRRLSINKNGKFNKETFYEKLRSNYLCPHTKNSGNQHNGGLIHGQKAAFLCEKIHSHKDRLVKLL
jgi:hypothetical protein